MPSDSDAILISGKAPDSLSSMLLDIASQVRFKSLGLMLIIFVLLSSDVFIGRILSKFSNAVEMKYPTSWGVCLQGLFLVLAMIMIDGLIDQKII